MKNQHKLFVFSNFFKRFSSNTNNLYHLNRSLIRFDNNNSFRLNRQYNTNNVTSSNGNGGSNGNNVNLKDINGVANGASISHDNNIYSSSNVNNINSGQIYNNIYRADRRSNILKGFSSTEEFNEYILRRIKEKPLELIHIERIYSK